MVTAFATHDQSLKQGSSLTSGTLRSSGSEGKAHRVLVQPLLVGQVLLPGDVGRVHILLQMNPPLH